MDVSLHDWERIQSLRRYQGYRKVVPFEPLLGPLPKDVSLKGMDWVIIGALGKGRKHFQPKREWVNDIVGRSRKLGIPVFMKGTLTDFKRLIQKYPLPISDLS